MYFMRNLTENSNAADESKQKAFDDEPGPAEPRAPGVEFLVANEGARIHFVGGNFFLETASLGPDGAVDDEGVSGHGEGGQDEPDSESVQAAGAPPQLEAALAPTATWIRGIWHLQYKAGSLL